ncbi:hypothetical protein GGS23DRAFT_600188 [Durotheca rogersii]|uniref:uncharacterized protein n=1 Tax=Durotheca rogersii TaxID=419775 RepID=UPI00221F311A|nr:uncharacterized protein GGS23DRAFT_600188 [Durotheca rogersii]KAI5859666.1 hypothetical protein GGS23DRAFT_600188 [Durotheca rogersii]
MRPLVLCCLQILATVVSAEPAALQRPIVLDQTPVMNPVGPVVPPADQPKRPEPPPSQGGVLISDVMGRDRSINIFAGFTRDVGSVSSRLDNSSLNSTVLAPRNSAIEKLPRKPWEDPEDYKALGADAYEGGDGRDRAHRNIRRFVEAHVVPVSPWTEGEKATALLDGDRQIWWEMRDGIKVLQPDGIEIDSTASQVGNGEVWVLNGVRNYA